MEIDGESRNHLHARFVALTLARAAPAAGTPTPRAPEVGASTDFTVIVQGVWFILTRDQCDFDSPNYFTLAFDGDFEEVRPSLPFGLTRTT